MRRVVVASSMLLAATMLTGAPPAQGITNEQTPCDSRVLMATHDANAESFDANRDRLECRPHDGSAEVPGDNAPKLDAPPAGPDSVKLYSFGTQFGRPTSVTSVDPAAHTFSGLMESQEGDPDLNGCSGMCPETLTYDANDYFYFDTGSGSTAVSMTYFETHVVGRTEFSMVYSRLPDEHSVFSFRGPADVVAPVTPPQVAGPALPTWPRHLHASPGNHKAFLHWTAPRTGKPIDAYQVRRRGTTYQLGETVPALTIHGLVNHRLYRFAVRAHNAAGWGAWSVVVKVRPHHR